MVSIGSGVGISGAEIACLLRELPTEFAADFVADMSLVDFSALLTLLRVNPGRGLLQRRGGRLTGYPGEALREGLRQAGMTEAEEHQRFGW